MILSVLAVAISLVALILSAWSAKIAQRASSLAFALNLLKEFRDPEAVAARRYVFTELRKEFSPDLGFRNLPEQAQTNVHSASLLCDHIGLCVAHNLVDQTIVAGFVGDSVQRLWSILDPYVRQERQLLQADGFSPEYLEYFEDLAVRLQRQSPSRSRRSPKKSRQQSGDHRHPHLNPGRVCNTTSHRPTSR
jgi:hypothetical protein